MFLSKFVLTMLAICLFNNASCLKCFILGMYVTQRKYPQEEVRKHSPGGLVVETMTPAARHDSATRGLGIGAVDRLTLIILISSNKPTQWLHIQVFDLKFVLCYRLKP